MFNAKPSDAKADLVAQPAADLPTTGEMNCSIINQWLVMRGDLESEGDIVVKGKVHGNITCKLLIVDGEAMIEGIIAADEVVIRGTTRGVIKARAVRIEKTARVESEIYHETFAAEQGARIKGSLRGYDELTAVVPADTFAAEPIQTASVGLEKQIGASLYSLLDQARNAHHMHLSVAQ